MMGMNTLLQSRVQQFDAKHGEPVRDKTELWLVYEDGASRRINPGEYDFIEPADQPEAETRRWQKYWCQESLPILAERFKRQKRLAIKATGTDGELKRAALKRLHARIAAIKDRLDALTTPAVPRAELDYLSWYGGSPAGKLPEGMTYLDSLIAEHQRLERSMAVLRRDLAILRGEPQIDAATAANRLNVWEQRLAARQKWVDDAAEAVRRQREWLAMSIEERQRIVDERLARDRVEAKRLRDGRAKELQELASLDLPFVEDDGTRVEAALLADM